MAKTTKAAERQTTLVHTTVDQQPTVTRGTTGDVLPAVAWHAVAKIAEKEMAKGELRNRFEEGASYAAEINVSAIVGGEVFEATADTVLTIGHDSERAASQTPNPAGLIAYLLGKMNEATRESVLRELPGQFTELGDYPAVSSDVEKATAEMLKKIRAAKRGPVRGQVKCQYAMR